MKSDLPKVLFPVLGRPMIHWVLDALETTGFEKKIVVVGYRADTVRSELARREGVEFVLQEDQLGTGHAVQMCNEHLASHQGPVLVVAGDSPLIQPSSIGKLVEEQRQNAWSCLLGTLLKENPTGLGRIVRDADNTFERIVEQKDASPDQLRIKEVNMSTYLFDGPALHWSLSQLTNDNAQGEYYVTDCPEILKNGGHPVNALPVLQACESLSINTIDELSLVEAKMREMGYRDHSLT